MLLPEDSNIIRKEVEDPFPVTIKFTNYIPIKGNTGPVNDRVHIYVNHRPTVLKRIEKRVMG